MSVLKGSAAGDVRSLSAVPPPVTVPRQRAPEPTVDPRLTALAAELAAVEKAFEAFRKQTIIDIEAARKAGIAEAKDDDDRRFHRLEGAVVEAVDAWRTRLDGLERLAAVLTKTALGKLFEASADLEDLVGRTITKRVRAIDAGSVVRVRVSTRDFGDDAALHALAVRVGLPVNAIVAETDAPAGFCQLDLSVGHLDLSIADQWSAIEGCLAAIAVEEPS
jgi:flagellar biosynthesis/type III secretory pathway protein FliH